MRAELLGGPRPRRDRRDRRGDPDERRLHAARRRPRRLDQPHRVHVRRRTRRRWSTVRSRPRARRADGSRCGVSRASTRAWAPWTSARSCRSRASRWRNAWRWRAAFGERLAAELSVPVFLYGHAARAEHRRTLQADPRRRVRGARGAHRAAGVAARLRPGLLRARLGRDVAGARDFLIAYNVNVLGTKEQAHRIALDVREAGRGRGSRACSRPCGDRLAGRGVRPRAGLDQPRRLPTTPPHAAFEACVERARALQLAVAGSELVGLIPLEALLLAAEHYVAKEGLFIVDERQRIRLAVERLGSPRCRPSSPRSGSSST